MEFIKNTEITIQLSFALAANSIRSSEAFTRKMYVRLTLSKMVIMWNNVQQIGNAYFGLGRNVRGNNSKDKRLWTLLFKHVCHLVRLYGQEDSPPPVDSIFLEFILLKCRKSHFIHHLPWIGVFYITLWSLIGSLTIIYLKHLRRERSVTKPSSCSNLVNEF